MRKEIIASVAVVLAASVAACETDDQRDDADVEPATDATTEVPVHQEPLIENDVDDYDIERDTVLDDDAPPAGDGRDDDADVTSPPAEPL